MKKRLLALILALLMCIPLITPAKANTASTASPLNFDHGTYGSVNPRSSQQWYKVEVPYSGTLSFKVTSDARYYCGYWRIEVYADPSSTALHSSNEYHTYTNQTKNPHKVGPFSVTQGTYYIVFSVGGGTSLSEGQGVEAVTYCVTPSFSCSHINTTKTQAAEPTCSAEGVIEERCDDCGEVIKTTNVAKLPHTPNGEWVITREATRFELGKRHQTCTVCGSTEYDALDTVGHTYGTWEVTQEATETAKGEETRECEYCGDKQTRTTPTLEHKLADNEAMVTTVNSSSPTIIVLVVPAFTDVAAGSWYQSAITYAYSLGLMVGTSDSSFNPTGVMSLAEAITMAARARNSYEGGENNDFAASSPWYQTYVDYALRKGMIRAGDFDDYAQPATRAQMAYIFAHALPSAGLNPINTVRKLPDVSETDKYGQEIFTLYRAGVLTGSDNKGTFNPDSTITRSEAAAIITRMTLTSERKTLNLS